MFAVPELWPWASAPLLCSAPCSQFTPYVNLSLIGFFKHRGGMNEQQQRMAAVETDKELNDLLDFSAVRESGGRE